jgi:probable LLM family oxidoreductase
MSAVAGRRGSVFGTAGKHEGGLCPARGPVAALTAPPVYPGDLRNTCVRKYVIGNMDLGLVTFADLYPGVTPEQRMRNLIEEARLADELGLTVFAVGEHHRPDYLVSSPATALAAIAAVTKDIRLASAVTVLSSDDPVRVFQQFAHVDLISGGRAEIIAGRGSFIESFPLFGYDLHDYDELFEEKLELLVAIRDQERVTWEGKHRAPLEDARIWPRPVQEQLPVWVAVGGTPESVVRAARLGLPLALAIIGGQTARFAPFAELYRRAWSEAGHEGEPRIAINTHAFIGDSRQDADRAFAAGYLGVMNRIGRERGWPPSGRAEYDALAGAAGPLAVGSPEEVAEKIVRVHQLFRPERYLGHISIGAVDHRDVMHAIELFGTKVAPLVHAEIAAVSSG